MEVQEWEPQKTCGTVDGAALAVVNTVKIFKWEV